MRFVGDGIAVGELATAAGLDKARTLSTLGGMERWRYVTVGPESADEPQRAKRDGWGSARGLRSDWIVRLTPAGRKAERIWRPLLDDIEGRWRERFGSDAIDELKRSLRTIVDELDVELPEYLPIVAGADGMVAGVSRLDRRDAVAGHDASASRPHLSVLLSRILLAYTIDFEQASELSLPLSANFVRVLDETGVGVRDLPALAGVSKEATSMALTFLAKTGYIAVEGAAAATKVARLTPKGRKVQRRYSRVHGGVEERWGTRFGAENVRAVRSSLQRLLDQRDGLSRGLEPHPRGWRASNPYARRTEALVDDPSAALPHYPMVLHRGGWPDGS
jgi:DNA-binding MarR family transcriptional regulator